MYNQNIKYGAMVAHLLNATEYFPASPPPPAPLYKYYSWNLDAQGTAGRLLIIPSENLPTEIRRLTVRLKLSRLKICRLK
jgi:hypothetical protein